MFVNASISGCLCISSLIQKILKDLGTSSMFCKTIDTIWNTLFMFVYQRNVLTVPFKLWQHVQTVLTTSYLQSSWLQCAWPSPPSPPPFIFGIGLIWSCVFFCILHWQMWNIFSNMPSRSCWVTRRLKLDQLIKETNPFLCILRQNSLECLVT